jgi:hypothetical protein
MNHSEIISSFVNNVLKGDSDAARAAFSTYCTDKVKSISQERKLNERLESLKAALLEYGYDDMDVSVSGAPGNDKAPIEMSGDKILVNGKLVGRIVYSMDDDDGINFVADDKSFSKEFNTAEELFSFLSKRFLGESTDE